MTEGEIAALSWQKKGKNHTVFQVAAVVWLAIAVVLLLGLGIAYWAAKWQVRGAKLLHDNVYRSDRVCAPAVYGILRPKIILPVEYEPKGISFVLLHERTHIKRADNFWRLAALVTAAIHWFNPFVWLFLNRFLTDMELACDEAVLRQCGETQRKAYASVLVDCAGGRSVFPSAWNGAKTRTRIEHILTYQKLSIFSTVCFAVLAVVIAYVLLANDA